MKQTCGTFDDAGEDVRVVVLKVAVDAETRAERRREQAGTGGGTDESEMVEVDLDGTRRGTFVDHDVNAVVLHRRIEVLLHDGAQTVDFIDEEHVVGFEGGEQAGEVTGFVEDRSGGYLEAYAQFVGDDIGEGGLSETRRAEKEDMIQALATHFGSLDEDLEVRGHLALTGEVGEAQRAQGVVLLFFGALLSYIKFHKGLWVMGYGLRVTGFFVEEGFQILYFVNRFVGFDDAMIEDDDAVTHLADFLHDVGGEDDRRLLAISY